MSRRLAIGAVLALLGGGSLALAWAEDPPAKLLGHNIFFSLKDPSDENKARLIEACKVRLSQHPGIVFFAVGTRDERINGGFNDKGHDVALHMVFTGREALGAYARTPDHQQFIVETTPLLKNVRIFDSAIETVANKSAIEPAKQAGRAR
jgi:hypothetical protein